MILNILRYLFIYVLLEREKYIYLLRETDWSKIYLRQYIFSYPCQLRTYNNEQWLRRSQKVLQAENGLG